jgi:hypothetical protein
MASEKTALAVSNPLARDWRQPIWDVLLLDPIRKTVVAMAINEEEHNADAIWDALEWQFPRCIPVKILHDQSHLLYRVASPAPPNRRQLEADIYDTGDQSRDNEEPIWDVYLIDTTTKTVTTYGINLESWEADEARDDRTFAEDPKCIPIKIQRKKSHLLYRMFTLSADVFVG